MTQTEQLNASPQGQIKACLFNLVIYAREGKRADYLRELETTILDRFPCRIIFIQQDSNPTQLDLSFNNQQRKFSYDEIFIRVGAQMLSRVPFLVIPHLVPDLPIYLLWGQDPTSEKEILPKLENYASRLIFDSECSSNLKLFAKDMLELMKVRKTDIMDLNWASISGWRDALAVVFDNEDSLNKLTTAQEIRISYNKRDTEYVRSHETKAIYLQSWLASRLGWKFLSTKTDNSTRTTVYQNSTGKTSVILEPETVNTLPAGAIINFQVFNNDCEFQILRRDDQAKVNVHTTRGDHCELPFALTLPDIKHRSVFMKEIFYQTINGHYRGMLDLIAQNEWE